MSAIKSSGSRRLIRYSGAKWNAFLKSRFVRAHARLGVRGREEASIKSVVVEGINDATAL